ncbi:unnamed protein product [Rangifer tarandus platyrhynchus]|uniref:Uncharacterized protein n=1 Tax=Rangifer tarandus platyrhynchus TaxID=3082113 RepID=A0ABN9A021_RANTA|nr:unnamed protein product [Rangifer tarandus platyrhynchus]
MTAILVSGSRGHLFPEATAPLCLRSRSYLCTDPGPCIPACLHVSAPVQHVAPSKCLGATPFLQESLFSFSLLCLHHAFRSCPVPCKDVTKTEHPVTAELSPASSLCWWVLPGAAAGAWWHI